MEGQPARGVFILCAGHVKLSTSSSDGRTLILRISEPGDLLGLPATISGRPYEVTADVIEPAQANFISQPDFLNFLREHGDAALRVAQELSEIEAIANNPAAVEAAFSNSSRPTSCGESWCAAIPEPITIAARNADPSSSASRRRASGGVLTARQSKD